MTEEAREERNRYQREWRAKNKDRVRAIHRRYWEKKVQTMPDVYMRKEKDKNDAIPENT